MLDPEGPIREADIIGLFDHSSAAKRIPFGMVTPSALAVLRLTTNSNFVGCSIGNSAGFAPFRIRATQSAVRPLDFKCST